MRHVISCPPTIEVSAFAAKLAQGRPVIADPARELCRRYGYQTLYEIPADLQKRLRLELIRTHADSLRIDENAICDHSVFASLADWMRWLWPATPAEEWESVLVAAQPAVDRSDAIHHVVEGPRSQYDGYRWLDLGNARQVDRLMRNLYRDFGVERRVKEISL